MAMEVAAVKATAEPSEGRARQKESVAASQTVRMGDLKWASTLLKKEGRPGAYFITDELGKEWSDLPRSRLKPYIIREFDVIENKPQCQMQTMTRTMRTIAPLLPKMSMRIRTTGCPPLLSRSTVVSKFWMEKRREMMRKKPKTAETPIDIKTPSGALQDAFMVSSDRWAEASNLT